MQLNGCCDHNAKSKVRSLLAATARCYRSLLCCIKRDASPRVTLYLIELSLAFQAIPLLYIILYVSRHQSSPLVVYIIYRVAEQAHNILTRRQNRKLKHAFWLFQPAPPCLCCICVVCVLCTLPTRPSFA